MTAGLEQLLYTWAPRGVEGSNRFQIAAATAGLSSRHAPLTATALKLCRYDSAGLSAAATEAPVSFGWADVGERRFVFRRVYVGRDASNRPGNFAAHILVGPPSMLPLGQVLARYNSPAWWGGLGGTTENPAGLRLKPTELALMPTGDQALTASEDLVRDLTGLLLAPKTRRMRIAVAADSPEVVAALFAVASVLPEVLEGVSVSSYERGGGADLFQIHGVGRGGRPPAGAVLIAVSAPRQAQPADVTTATRLTLSADGGDWRLVDAAKQVARERSSSFDTECFVSLVGALEAIGSGEQVDSAQISTVLQSPGPAELVLSLPEGLRVVAGHLLDGDRRTLDALAAVAGDVAPSLLMATGQEVGRRLVAQRAVGRFPQAQRLLQRAGELLLGGVCEQVFTSCQADPSLLNTENEVEVLLELLIYADNAQKADQEVGGLLDEAVPFYWRLGGSASLPLRWRARICAGALQNAPRAAIGVSDFVADDPRLVGEMLCHLADLDVLREVVLRLPLTAVLQVLEELWPVFGRAEWIELAHQRVIRLKPAEQVVFLSKIARKDRGSPVWDDLACSVLRRTVDGLLADESRSPIPNSRIQAVLTLSTGEPARQWSKLLHALEDAEDKRSTGPLRRVRAATISLDGPAGTRLAALLLMVVSAGVALSATDVAVAVDELRLDYDVPTEDLVRLLAVVSYRAAYVSRNTRAAHAVLMYLATDMVGARLVALDRRHRLVDPRLQEVTVAAAQMVSDSLWEFGERHVQDFGGRPGASWWQTLSNDRQKEQAELLAAARKSSGGRRRRS